MSEQVLFGSHPLIKLLIHQTEVITDLNNKMNIMTNTVDTLKTEIRELKDQKREKISTTRKDTKPVGTKNDTSSTKTIPVEDSHVSLSQVMNQKQKTFAEITANDKDDFQRVSRRRRQRGPETIGTASGDSGFVGIPKKAWLYVGRVNKTVNKEDIKQYLSKKFSNVEFTIENLNSKGPFSSFRIGFDFQHLEMVNKPEVWPQEVRVRKFRFFQRNLERRDHSPTLRVEM